MRTPCLAIVPPHNPPWIGYPTKHLGIEDTLFWEHESALATKASGKARKPHRLTRTADGILHASPAIALEWQHTINQLRSIT